jgi:hypothetical protein
MREASGNDAVGEGDVRHGGGPEGKVDLLVRDINPIQSTRDGEGGVLADPIPGVQALGNFPELEMGSKVCPLFKESVAGKRDGGRGVGLVEDEIPVASKNGVSWGLDGHELAELLGFGQVSIRVQIDVEHRKRRKRKIQGCGQKADGVPPQGVRHPDLTDGMGLKKGAPNNDGDASSMNPEVAVVGGTVRDHPTQHTLVIRALKFVTVRFLETKKIIVGGELDEVGGNGAVAVLRGTVGVRGNGVGIPSGDRGGGGNMPVGTGEGAGDNRRKEGDC